MVTGKEYKKVYFKISDEVDEQVTPFIYLGQILVEDLYCNNDVHRISMAKQAFREK